MLREGDTGSKEMKIQKGFPWRRLFLVPVVLVVGFLTFVGIRMVTIEAKSEFVLSYNLPEMPKLSEIYSVGTGSYAVAIDGVKVAGQEAEAVRPTASTAKMILGLAVIQKKPFGAGETGEILTISEEDYDNYLWYLNNNGSNVPVTIGEEISEYEALTAVFLASANNMADTLARWAFGSVEGYQEYASKMLEEMGVSGVTFGTDASGYNEGTTASAESLARIGYLVMQEPVLREIVGRTEAEVPVAGEISNTNQLLGTSGIIGVKTGYIGEPSGYCLVSAYEIGGHIVSVARLGAETREASFAESLGIVTKMQETVTMRELIVAGETVGKVSDWWNGEILVKAGESLSALGYDTGENSISAEFEKGTGRLSVKVGNELSEVKISAAEDFKAEPSFLERFLHVFGWKKEVTKTNEDSAVTGEVEATEETKEAPSEVPTEETEASETVADTADIQPITELTDDNCTIPFGKLMLINPNFTVGLEFIDARRWELVSLWDNYGISELHYYNGDNLLDAEAAAHIAEMLAAYKEFNPGHEMQTVSCYRARGTSCGRLCAATGASDHHTGLTCDLIDPAYGERLYSEDLPEHPEWQWLKANSYKYGFIDRFPEAWAGGSMDEPLNVDENGSTGLFETWHYRYVGVTAATEIATGKYNNGEYDSLEHYLLMRGLVKDLKNGVCGR